MRGNWFHPHLDMSVSVSMCVYLYILFSLSVPAKSMAHSPIALPRSQRYAHFPATFAVSQFRFSFHLLLIVILFRLNMDPTLSPSLFYGVYVRVCGPFYFVRLPSSFFLLLRFSVSFINLIFSLYIYLAQTNNTRLIAGWMFAGLLARSLDSLPVDVCIRSQKLTFLIVVIAISNCIQIQLKCIWLI